MATRRKRVLLPASKAASGGKILMFQQSGGGKLAEPPQKLPSQQSTVDAQQSAGHRATVERAEDEHEIFFAVMGMLSKVPSDLLWKAPHLELLSAIRRVWSTLVPMADPQSMLRRAHNEARENMSGVSVWPIDGQEYSLAEGWRAYYLVEGTGPKTSRGYRIATPRDIDPMELEGLMAQLPPCSFSAFFKFMQSSYGWTRI